MNKNNLSLLKNKRLVPRIDPKAISPNSPILILPKTLQVECNFCEATFHSVDVLVDKAMIEVSTQVNDHMVTHHKQILEAVRSDVQQIITNIAGLSTLVVCSSLKEKTTEQYTSVELAYKDQIDKSVDMILTFILGDDDEGDDEEDSTLPARPSKQEHLAQLKKETGKEPEGVISFHSEAKPTEIVKEYPSITLEELVNKLSGNGTKESV